MRPRLAVEASLLLFCAALPVSIAVLNMSAAALTASLLWAWAAGEKVDWKSASTSLTAALCVYVAVAALSAAHGLKPELSFATLHKDVHKVWLLVVLLVGLKLARPRQTLAALGGSLLIVSLFGIGQALFLRVGGSSHWERAHAFVHPVTFGELLALCWIGGLCAWLVPERARAASAKRLPLAAVLVVTALALVLNQTRGAFLGLAAGVLAFGLADRRWRRVSLGALGAVVACFFLLELLPTGHTFHDMIARRNDPNGNPFLARLTLWRVGLQIFRDHPLLGVGPGNYRTVFTAYFQGSFDGESVWGSAHSLYIHQAAERGLLGLAALFAALGIMTYRAFRRCREGTNAANLWSLGACAAFLVMNLTEVAFQNEQVTSLLLFIWAWAETAPD